MGDMESERRELSKEEKYGDWESFCPGVVVDLNETLAREDFLAGRENPEASSIPSRPVHRAAGIARPHDRT